ncbi:MAG TPA: hypothetical protein VGE09_06305 [Pseudoxanthomonas sp.]
MTEQRVRMVAQLYEARDQIRKLLGNAYSARMAEYGKAIEAIAAKKNITLLQAGIAAAKTMQDDGQAYTAIAVLAATVELLEPSAPAASPESEG